MRVLNLLVSFVLLQSSLIPVQGIDRRLRVPPLGQQQQPLHQVPVQQVNNIPIVRQRGGGAVIAGRLHGILKKIRSFNDLPGIAKAFDWTDILWLSGVGWLTEPVAKWWHTHVRQRLRRDGKEYENTWLHRVASVVSQLGKLGALVYSIDMTVLVLEKIGFQVPKNINQQLANLIYTLWGALKVRNIKNWWLRQHFDKDHHLLFTGREKVASLLIDASIGVFCLFFIQDLLHVTFGRGLQSIFAIGGISGIMISLAAKDLAQMFLSGIVINSSEKYIEGEKVKFGDGTEGTITKLGAFDMHIRGGDGIITRIPNAQIVNQRMQTLSRMTESQVKQTLWFKYDDIDKIREIADDIEAEITSSCSKLLSVRALWTEFKDDHLEVVVKAHFEISPTSDEYDENKEVVLQAIAQAVKKNGVEFAIPTSICKNENIR